jgi:hypothetical protein
VSDIDTVVVDSLKVLDPERPIREATFACLMSLCGCSGFSPFQSSRLSGTMLSPAPSQIRCAFEDMLV